jgi:hypothetical protein
MISIINPSTRRAKWDFTNAILFGSLLVISGLNDLGVPKTESQHEQYRNNYVPDETDAPSQLF